VVLVRHIHFFYLGADLTHGRLQTAAAAFDGVLDSWLFFVLCTQSRPAGPSSRELALSVPHQKLPGCCNRSGKRQGSILHLTNLFLLLPFIL
jgi:hypothetical protein